MNKKVLIIVGTLLAMALVAAALVLWLIPGGNNVEEPGQTTGNSAVNGDQVPGDTQGEDSNDGPTVGVEVEVPGNTENSGNTGNTGSTGNTGNTGSTGNQGGNNEIDFDDLLGAG